MNISRIQSSVQTSRIEEPEKLHNEHAKDPLSEIRQYYQNNPEPISLGLDKIFDTFKHNEKLEEIKKNILKESGNPNAFEESLCSLGTMREIDYALIDAEFNPKLLFERRESLNPIESIQTYRTNTQEHILTKDIEIRDKKIYLLEKEIEELRNRVSNISSPSFTPKKNLDEPKSQNNTSSSFYLPSELKNNWNNFVSHELVGLFADFFEHPLITVNLIQDLVLVCIEYVNQLISDKYAKVLEMLNLKKVQNFEFGKYFQRLFQDYYNVIFSFDKNSFLQIRSIYKEKCKRIMSFDYKSELANIDREQPEDTINSLVGGEVSFDGENKFFDFYSRKEDFEFEILRILESEEFEKTCQTIFDICVSLALNEPPLKIPIDDFEERKFEYRKFNKNEFLCIDGFAKEGVPSLVILPAIFRKERCYNGIKPTVLILNPDSITSNIFLQMESHAQIQIEKDQKRGLSAQKEYLDPSPKIDMSPISMATDHEMPYVKPMDQEFSNFNEPLQFTLSKSFSVLDQMNKNEKETNFLSTKTLETLEKHDLLSKEQIAETIKEKLKIRNQSDTKTRSSKNFNEKIINLDEMDTCPREKIFGKDSSNQKPHSCYFISSIAVAETLLPDDSEAPVTKRSDYPEDHYSSSPETKRSKENFSSKQYLSNSKLDNIKMKIRSNLDQKLKRSEEFDSFHPISAHEYEVERQIGYITERIPQSPNISTEYSPIPKNMALRNNIGKIVNQSTSRKFKTQKKLNVESAANAGRFKTPSEIRKLEFSSDLDDKDQNYRSNTQIKRRVGLSNNNEILREKDVNTRIINAVKNIYNKIN